VVAWITTQLDGLRRQLATDEALRQGLDRWVKARVIGLIERYHDRIARFIERGVHALGPEGAVRLIEEHAGDDLQYIRVNGTVVGGLAGGGPLRDSPPAAPAAVRGLPRRAPEIPWPRSRGGEGTAGNGRRGAWEDLAVSRLPMPGGARLVACV
jgi:hypothetical protein